MNRREFGTELASISVCAYAALKRMSIHDASGITTDRNRPNITHGVSAGDLGYNNATIWSRANRPSRMIVEVSQDEYFQKVRRFEGPVVLRNDDFAGKVHLKNLRVGQKQFYRVQFQDLDNSKKYSAPVIGQFNLAARQPRNVRFGWSGDTAGQGYGIDKSKGGMATYAAIEKQEPDFFVHCGDVCYCDNPFEKELTLDDGTIWKNIVTESTSKVAETLKEFRENFKYNLLDDNVRQMNAKVPIFAQWDDHEVVNNWYPGEILDDDRYTVKSVSLLAARAKKAFFEFMPIRQSYQQTIYRKIDYGPLLSLFFLDLRSRKGPNSENRQTVRGADTSYMGRQQLRWLKLQLSLCRATWKFISIGMPIGLVVKDGGNFENCANGNGPARGRELEVADLLQFIKENNIENVVFLTADVHHAASHYYKPNRAKFTQFNPFWEFVSGPLHAGTFGPNELDNTFGPKVRFNSVPDGMEQNRPPSEGLQFFGIVNIDAESKVANVAHFNRAGEKIWNIDLQPA